MSSENLGELVGKLRVANEAVEIGICAAASLAWLAAWKLFGVVGPITMVVGILVTIGILYFAYKALFGAWEIYDLGVVARPLLSSPQTFAYEDLRSMKAKKTLHFRDRMYIGTQSEITLLLDGAKEVHLKTDYRQDTPKEQMVDALLRRCSEPLERQLFSDLKERGEVHWGGRVYLAAEGLKIMDAGPNSSRTIPFSSIAELKMTNDEMSLYKVGDALPFLVLRKDDTNFIPKFHLFCALTSKTHELREQTEAAAQFV